MKLKFKLVFVISFLLGFFSFGQKDEIKLNELVNQWHISAAKAEFKNYFDATSENFIFLSLEGSSRVLTFTGGLERASSIAFAWAGVSSLSSSKLIVFGFFVFSFFMFQVCP